MVVQKMNVIKIQELQWELNTMIDNDDDFNKIYKASVELDLLIVQYYNEILGDNFRTNKI